MRRSRRSTTTSPPANTIRPARSGLLPEEVTATINGAGGEISTGFWYLPDLADDSSREMADETIRRRLLGAASPLGSARPDVLERERARLLAVADRGERAGLQGLELCDFLYLMERMPRWATPAYAVGMVTPFLAPDFVTAAFALTPQQKRDRVLHLGLIKRYVPEWTEVPFVSVFTGRSAAARIWDGDGLPSVHRLLDTVHGDLSGLMRRDVVEAAVVDCAIGSGKAAQQKVLQQFAWLATASLDFEPSGVRPATVGYASFVRPHLRANRPPRTVRSVLGPVVGRVKRPGSAGGCSRS